MEGVTYVNTEVRLKPSCDSARILTHARDVVCNTELARNAGLTAAYTGKGILAGVIDIGIDFQHIAFKDKNGNSRIKRAYMKDVFYDQPDTLRNDEPAYLGYGHGTESVRKILR